MENIKRPIPEAKSTTDTRLETFKRKFLIDSKIKLDVSKKNINARRSILKEYKKWVDKKEIINPFPIINDNGDLLTNPTTKTECIEKMNIEYQEKFTTKHAKSSKKTLKNTDGLTGDDISKFIELYLEGYTPASPFTFEYGYSHITLWQEKYSKPFIKTDMGSLYINNINTFFNNWPIIKFLEEIIERLGKDDEEGIEIELRVLGIKNILAVVFVKKTRDKNNEYTVKDCSECLKFGDFKTVRDHFTMYEDMIFKDNILDIDPIVPEPIVPDLTDHDHRNTRLQEIEIQNLKTLHDPSLLLTNSGGAKSFRIVTSPIPGEDMMNKGDIMNESGNLLGTIYKRKTYNTEMLNYHNVPHISIDTKHVTPEEQNNLITANLYTLKSKFTSFLKLNLKSYKDNKEKGIHQNKPRKMRPLVEK